MRKRSWGNEDLIEAVKTSRSIRQVIEKLGLIPAGGNYMHVKNTIEYLGLDISHMTGRGWRHGTTGDYTPHTPLNKILIAGSSFQSYKLKLRLFREGLKVAKCELCGWAEQTQDGRIPVELDHINGDRYDNRFENIRILCPNCHSLQPTHRGLNQKRRGGGTGIHAPLKMVSRKRYGFDSHPGHRYKAQRSSWDQEGGRSRPERAKRISEGGRLRRNPPWADGGEGIPPPPPRTKQAPLRCLLC